MSLLHLVVKSLRYYWRSNLAVALGVATATAVLTGALLVGDSVRGSLRDLVLDRLGAIDEVMVTDRFFRSALVDELASSDRFAARYAVAEAAILVQGSIKNTSSGQLATGVTVIGCREGFWRLGHGGPTASPTGDQLVLNSQLAGPDALDVQAGDTVVLQIGRSSEIPADSPLGRKTDTVRRKQLTVSAVIPNEGLGRFGLSPSQQLPANAFVDVSTLQTMLEIGDRVNAIFTSTSSPPSPPNRSHLMPATDNGVAANDLGERVGVRGTHLKPTLADYGVKLEPIEITDATRTVLRYHNLTSNRMLLERPVLDAAARAWSRYEVQPALTYLANWITAGERRLPYSTVTAIDSTEALGPLRDEAGQPILLADDEIVLNDWAARQLGVQPGAANELTYFEPDTTHGQVREETANFRLKAVVPLGGDGQAVTAANDRALTPELVGVTDQASIEDWNPPFPFEPQRIRKDRDERYWDDYRATPKAFVNLATGRRLWGSRFGDTTSLRVLAPSEVTTAELAAALEAAIEPPRLGFVFRPVKQQGLEASSGTTPFDVLFLLFSMFLIAAALMLVALLFRLGLEHRTTEIGLYSAVGFAGRRVGRILLLESLLVAALGAFVGVAGGVGYAWLLLVGLRTRTLWLAAVSTPFLQLHVTWPSLLMGFAGGLAVCWLTICVTLRGLRRFSVRQLLSGAGEEAVERTGGHSRRSAWLAGAALVAACGLVPVALTQHGEAQAGAFFAAGGLMLFAALVWLRGQLRAAGSASRIDGLGLVWLAARNAARNPGRSTLTIGLMAAASFLIIAISAFRLEESGRGSGGFDLLANSSAPLYHDLGSEAGRFELGLDAETSELLAGANTVALRVRGGDDASCLNLYEPRQPRVLGVPASMGGEFEWAATTGGKDEPWSLLQQTLPLDDDGRPRIPVVLDQNTALYSLHLWQGVGATLEIEDGAGGTVTLQVVGLLKNSIFQGDLLISEDNFLKLFPDVGGYQFFLMRSPVGHSSRLQAGLEDRLADYGFDVVTSRQRLASLFAVQNTYLSTFQSLGGLGLLLGTFGLAVVQVRNVVLRRGELALMRATGFRRRRLAAVVLVENALLLLCGIGIGTLASLVAVFPHMLLGGAKIPWWSLAATLTIVLAFGLLAGLAAVRATLRVPLLAALRGE